MTDFGGKGSRRVFAERLLAEAELRATVSGGVTGRGTLNALPRWTSAATLGDSIITQSGTTVTVTGTLAVTTRVTSPLLGTTSAVDLVLDRNSVTQLTLGSLQATWGVNASGSNAAASSYTHLAPRSTGNATPAALVWQVGVQGASSSTLQTATEGLRVQEFEVGSGGSRVVQVVALTGFTSGVPLNAVAGLRAEHQTNSTFFVTRADNFPQIAGRRFNGSYTVPTAVLSGEVLTSFTGGGYDGTILQLTGSMRVVARENFSGTALGTALRFRAAQITTTTIRDVMDLTVDTSSVASIRAGLATLRLVAGSTALVIRDSGDTLDAVTFNAAGTLASFATNVTVGTGYQVSGTQVVGAQGASIANPTGGGVQDAEARTAIDSILSRLEAHGLIAT